MEQLPAGVCGLCRRSLVRIGRSANRVNVCNYCDTSKCPNGHDVRDGTAVQCGECARTVPAHIPRDE